MAVDGAMRAAINLGVLPQLGGGERAASPYNGRVPVRSTFLSQRQQTEMPRPTLRHIAQRLGVSATTISLAMQGSTRISTATRQRVALALEESGYVYQRSAAGLRTAKTHTVGVILNNITDPFFSNLLASLEEALARAGRTVFLCNSQESVARQADFLRAMAEYNADGIIISPAIGSTPDQFLRPRIELPPLVFILRTLLGLDCDHVINDDRQALTLAMNRLLSLGHRRIALVGGDPSVSCFRVRLEAYKDALNQASIEFEEELIIACHPTRAAGFEAAGRIAGRVPQPRAALCYNDSVALGLSAGLQRHGLFPGRNFALIGNEDVEEAALTNPALSSTIVPRNLMGTTAAELLLKRIEDPDMPPRQLVLESGLVIRETCGVHADGSPASGPAPT